MAVALQLAMQAAQLFQIRDKLPLGQKLRMSMENRYGRSVVAYCPLENNLQSSSGKSFNTIVLTLTSTNHIIWQSQQLLEQVNGSFSNDRPRLPHIFRYTHGLGLAPRS
jgi:hypothetical protein